MKRLPFRFNSFLRFGDDGRSCTATNIKDNNICHKQVPEPSRLFLKIPGGIGLHYLPGNSVHIRVTKSEQLTTGACYPDTSADGSWTIDITPSTTDHLFRSISIIRNARQFCYPGLNSIIALYLSYTEFNILASFQLL